MALSKRKVFVLVCFVLVGCFMLVCFTYLYLKERERQTDRRTDGQTDRQTHTQTNRQTDRLGQPLKL